MVVNPKYALVKLVSCNPANNGKTGKLLAKNGVKFIPEASPQDLGQLGYYDVSNIAQGKRAYKKIMAKMMAKMVRMKRGRCCWEKRGRTSAQAQQDEGEYRRLAYNTQPSWGNVTEDWAGYVNPIDYYWEGQGHPRENGRGRPYCHWEEVRRYPRGPEKEAKIGTTNKPESLSPFNRYNSGIPKKEGDPENEEEHRLQAWFRSKFPGMDSAKSAAVANDDTDPITSASCDPEAGDM
jgi:hypothetical protein